MWHNVEMLEYATKQESGSNYIARNENSSAKFFNFLEHHRNDGAEGSMATTQIILETIKDLDGILYNDVGTMYPLIKGGILVRREDIETVMHSLLENQNINIEPKGLYPNVAWFDPAYGSAGLKNAFLEGRAQLNGVVAVVGFEPSDMLAVVDQKDIPDEPGVFSGRAGEELDRRLVASAHGVVSHDDISFVVFRFPFQHFPERDMTDEEVLGGDKNPNGKLQYIFRGVHFHKTSEPSIH